MKEPVEISAGTAVTNVPPPARRSSSVLPWLGLVSILVLYVFCVERIHPTNFFGFTEDDSVYFSSAKALAEGKGYILPSVPGTPPATKYPILYAWTLSWIWRWNPSFPDNLSTAVALNKVFGCAYLTIAFLFLRGLRTFSHRSILLLTGLCAVNPTTQLCSVLLMSDIPFAFVALLACLLTNRAMEGKTGIGSTVLAGTLAGLTLLIRTLGAPFAAGLYLAMILRTGWRKSTVFAACTLPFMAAALWQSIAAPKIAPVAVSMCSNSWRMTWLYYTSYAGYWKSDTLSNHVLWQTLRSNIVVSLLQPGAYFLNPSAIRPALLASVPAAILSAIAIRGMIRQARTGGLQPIHFAIVFYLLPLLFWDYADPARYLLPFLPLIAAGICTEVQYLARLVRASLCGADRSRNWAAVMFFGVVATVLLACSVVSWWYDMRWFTDMGQSRAALLAEKRQAYVWLQHNSPVDSRIIAYEDASAFLYTARQGLRPTIFSAAGVYRRDVLNSELSCVTSNSEPIGASYWIVAADDFGMEWEPARSRARSKVEEIEKSLQPLFRSRQGHVRIYSLAPGGRPLN